MSARPRCLAVAIALLACRGPMNAERVEPAVDAYQRGDWAGAIALLEPYLEDYPRHVDAWVILGNAREQLDQDAAAKTAYDQALSLDAKSPKALTGLGILARKRSAYPEAMTYYQRAVAADPKYAEAYSSMAVVALKLEEDAKAVEYAEKAWKLDSSNGQFASNLAIAYHYAGRARERDEMVAHAKRLGYPKMDALTKIIAGELTVRD